MHVLRWPHAYAFLELQVPAVKATNSFTSEKDYFTVGVEGKTCSRKFSSASLRDRATLPSSSHRGAQRF